MRRLLLAGLATIPAACATPVTVASGSTACQFAGETTQARIELFFGLTRPHGAPVSQSEWRDFVTREVTPRFPDGFTEIEAAGQWRDRMSNRIGREPSRIILLVGPPVPGLGSRVAEIRSLYRRRFDQQAVGVTSSRVCAGF